MRRFVSAPFVVILTVAWLVLSISVVGAAPPAARKPASAVATDPVIGYWYTEGQEGGVELYACGDKICGRFKWVKPSPEGIARDDKNPDPAKRQRPLCHMQFMSDFKPDGQGHYEDGLIYSPRHGHNFNAEMTLTNHDTLDLHGYVLTPILGESQTWTRAQALPDCDAKP